MNVCVLAGVTFMTSRWGIPDGVCACRGCVQKNASRMLMLISACVEGKGWVSRGARH